MIVRAINNLGDWIYGIGKNAYLTDQAAISQRIKCRLNSFLGDCFFDLESGMDWFNLLGGKDLTALNVAVTATILNTEGVQGIRQISLTLNRTTRVLTVSYQVQTIYSVLGSTFQFALMVTP